MLWGDARAASSIPASAFKKSRARRRRRDRQVPPARRPSRSTTRWSASRRPFTLRYPLVEGQGNFGNIDGDNAAAYRYTEARLTTTAMQLMDGLDEGTVDFVPTYNGEEEEPEIFPGLFPNLLANGSSGIAVGMATIIPSHNVAEMHRRDAAADRQPARRARRADGACSTAPTSPPAG